MNNFRLIDLQLLKSYNKIFNNFGTPDLKYVTLYLEKVLTRAIRYVRKSREFHIKIQDNLAGLDDDT